MKHPAGQVLVMAAAIAVAALEAHCATIGPLPYRSIADSPFDLSRLGVDFYVENFSTELLHIPPTGSGGDPFFTKFSTPGASETSGYGYPFANPAGGELHGLPQYVDFWAGLQSVDLSFEFDANELGHFPNAIGFRITNGSPITVNFYAADGSLIERLFAPTAPLPPGPPPTGMAAAMDYYLRFRFFGAITPVGIARVTVSSPVNSLILQDFQYGQQIPEPNTLFAIIAISLFCTHPRRR